MKTPSTMRFKLIAANGPQERRLDYSFWLVGWLVGWLVCWLVGWLVGWLAEWWVGWLAEWLAGWPNG